MATLYELTEEYRQLLDMMEDDSVDPEVLKDTLEGVDGELEIKAENCAKVMAELCGIRSRRQRRNRLGNADRESGGLRKHPGKGCGNRNRRCENDGNHVLHQIDTGKTGGSRVLFRRSPQMQGGMVSNPLAEGSRQTGMVRGYFR